MALDMGRVQPITTNFTSSSLEAMLLGCKLAVATSEVAKQCTRDPDPRVRHNHTIGDGREGLKA